MRMDFAAMLKPRSGGCLSFPRAAVQLLLYIINPNTANTWHLLPPKGAGAASYMGRCGPRNE